MIRSRRVLACGLLFAVAATGFAALSPSVSSFFDLRIQDAMLRAAPPGAPRRGWEARDRTLTVPAPRDPEELLALLRGLLGGSGVPVTGAAGRVR